MPSANTSDPIDVEVEDSDALEDTSAPLGDQLEHLGNQVAQLVVERPLAAVGIALGVGFLIGRLFRR